MAPTHNDNAISNAYELGRSDVLFDGACNWGIHDGCTCPLCYAAYQKGVSDGYAELADELGYMEPKSIQNTAKATKLSDDPAFGSWKDKGIEGVDYQQRARYTDKEL